MLGLVQVTFLVGYATQHPPSVNHAVLADAAVEKRSKQIKSSMHCSMAVQYNLAIMKQQQSGYLEKLIGADRPKDLGNSHAYNDATQSRVQHCHSEEMSLVRVRRDLLISSSEVTRPSR